MFVCLHFVQLEQANWEVHIQYISVLFICAKWFWFANIWNTLGEIISIIFGLFVFKTGLLGVFSFYKISNLS